MPPKSKAKAPGKKPKSSGREDLWVWMQPKRPPTISEKQFQNYNWHDLRTYFGLSEDDTEEIRLLIDDALLTLPGLLDKAVQGAGIREKKKWADAVSSHLLRECSDRIIIFFGLDNKDETGYAMWRMALWRRLRIKRNHARSTARLHAKKDERKANDDEDKENIEWESS